MERTLHAPLLCTEHACADACCGHNTRGFDTLVSLLQGNVGAVGAPQAPEYKVEEMTFELEEEKIPVYRPPIEEDADGVGGPDPGSLPGKTSGIVPPMGHT